MHLDFANRPSPTSVVATMVLALAASPLADAATSKHRRSKKPTIVARARYADNAGQVNGYSASFVPTPNSLVPLGPDGRLPVSVIPRFTVTGVQGPAGPVGPRGPQGPSGLNSPGVVTIVFQADGTSKNPTNASAEAVCPTATKVLGGGFNDLSRTVPALASNLPPGSVDEVQESDPFVRSDGSSGWRTRIVNVPSPTMIDGKGGVVPNALPPGSTYFQAYAICG